MAAAVSGATGCYYHVPTRRNVPQLLFTAFSNREDAVELARAAAEQLQAAGVPSSLHLLDGGDSASLDGATLVVSLGGDGTFLQSARLAHEHGARVLAVNLGRLGFLLNVPPSELVQDINHALTHDHVAERLALSIAFSDATVQEFSLNEVVVERAHAGHMVRVKTLIDGDEFLTYSADGVMVATPTGSTGYNFSAGGPVVDATLPVMMVTPIAPHFTIDRSIVVSGETVVRFIVADKPAIVVADGRTIGTLEPGQSIEVRRSATPVRVVAARSFDLGFRLRESLREGHA
ncbi:MAG: NAD(+)/NADH kinase [Acidimicrobiales bacterium]